MPFIFNKQSSSDRSLYVMNIDITDYETPKQTKKSDVVYPDTQLTVMMTL